MAKWGAMLPEHAAESGEGRVHCVRSQRVVFAAFWAPGAGTWAADSEVWTVCKLGVCSESSSDGGSIVSQCCIPWFQ